MKRHILLVITNTVQAKIYQVTGNDYVLVKELNHSRSRLKTKQLDGDKPGHYKTSHAAHGSFSSTNLHEEEHEHFAKIVAEFMKKALDKKHDQHIILCAEPHFYGLINQHLSKAIKASIMKVIERDYIPLPEQKLNKTIEKILHEQV